MVIQLQHKLIDVIAPSSATSKVFNVDVVRQYLGARGYTIRVPEGLIDMVRAIPYHANTDEERYRHTLNAIQSDDSDIIWCLRGGYGAAKVVEKLISENIRPAKKKVMIGFSDITALLIHVEQQFGWKAIHGAVLSQIGDKKINQDNIAAVIAMLDNLDQKQVFSDVVPITENITKKFITGQITGGNLCIIQSSIGTGWQINAAGKILVIEDVDERGYRIDRMLHHLKGAGILDGVLAIVCNFTGGDELDGSNLIKCALHDFAKQVDFPIFSCDKIGHGYDNMPFILGNMADIAKTV